MRIVVAMFALVMAGCGWFEPRDAEAPTESGGQFPPATDPKIAVSNLQQSVDLKSVQNYVACFSTPASDGRSFVFIPSSEGSAQYASVFSSWTTAEEQAYFQNLSARTTPTSTSSLVLTEKSFFLSGDSALAEYDYTLTFEHTDATFPKVATGNLQFAIGRNNANIWSIYRWADFKTTASTSWSLFKGKFSN
ncbi:MAG: hypothetical protein AB1428_07400 [Bacteroidota bacterium]